MTAVQQAPQSVDGGWLISAERGGAALLPHKNLQNQVPGMESPTASFNAGYALQCSNSAVFAGHLSDNQIVYRELTRNMVAVACQPALGGTLIVTNGAGETLWGV